MVIRQSVTLAQSYKMVMPFPFSTATMKPLLKLLKRLVEQGSSPEAKEKVLGQLEEQGWQEHPGLPAGWLRRKKEGKETIEYPTPGGFVCYQYLVHHPFFGKFNTKYAAVSGMRKQGLDKGYMARFVAVDSGIPHRLGQEGQEGWVDEGGRTLPQGWKIRRVEEEGSEILSPELVAYKDRVAALRHLAQELCRDVYTRGEVEGLRDCLVHEGWQGHTMIPEKWMIRRTKNLSEFLTKEVHILENYSEAMKFIAESKASKLSVQEVLNFREAAESLRWNPQPQALPMVEVPEQHNLPQGWRLDRLEGELIQISAPDGNTFFSRIKAMEHMLEEGVADEHVLGLWRELDQEGWRFGIPHLPQGWGVRAEQSEEGFIFLTRELEVLVSSEQALAYIEQEDNYTGEDYKRLDRWVDLLKGGPWEEEDDLPQGWKRREDDDEETLFLQMKTGIILTGRVALVRCLIKEGEKPESVIKLWETLDMEGWMTDDRNLPPGWKSKYDLDTSHFQYLSPLMEVVAKPEEVLGRGEKGEDWGILVEHLQRWRLEREAEG